MAFTVETVFRAIDRVTAPVSRMQQSVQRFTRSTGRMLRGINQGINRAAGAAWSGVKRIGLAGAALATGAMLTINRVAASADELAKTTRRIQFPIEEFQEWRFIAEQSGTPVSTLEQSLGAFTKRLGEARAGTGALNTFLKKSNPAFLEQLKSTTNTAEALDLYIGAIRDAGNANDQAALASAGFSRAGLKMINMAHNSESALAALRAEARRNGLITQKQAEAAEAYNDAMNSLKRTFTGFLQAAILPLLPRMTELIRHWQEVILLNREDIVDNVVKGFKELVAFGRKVVEFFKGLAAHRETIKKVVYTVIALVAILKTLAVVMAIVNIAMMANPAGLIVLGITALIAAATALIIWWEDLRDTFVDSSPAMKASIGALFGPIGSLIGVAAEVFTAWEPLKAFFVQLWADITGIFTKQIDKIGGMIDKAADRIKGIAGAVGSFFNGDERRELDRRGRPLESGLVTQSERVQRAVSESTTTERTEVTLRDETGRASVTRGGRSRGFRMTQTAAFE